MTTEFKGNLSRILGIENTFDTAMYDRLMRGMEPELMDGKEKKLTLRLDADRIEAWDWTFNRPKSVSVAKLVGGDSRIDDVETKAEQAAMKYIESQATVKVRKKSEVGKEKHPKGWKYPERETNNLLYIPFRHPSARDGSPHSHTHFVILNLSFDKQERVFKAVCLKHVDRKEASAIYRNEMIRGLNKLGYKTRRVGQEYEISGFPAEVKAIYSPRHEGIVERRQEMEAKAHELSKKQAVERGVTVEEAEKLPVKPMSEKAKKKLSVYDRPEKAANVPLLERRAGWLSRMNAPQSKIVHGVVRKARQVARTSRDSFAHWHEGIARYASRLRTNVIHHETEAPERSRDNGRSR